MSDTTLSRFNVTAQDLQSFVTLDTPHFNNLHQWSDHFKHLASEHQRDENPSNANACSLLRVVTSFFPNFESKGNPFGPLWQNLQGPGSRSLVAEDLVSTDIDALEGVTPLINSPELRARVADVVWECRKKSHAIGKIAILAYLDCANRFQWTGSEYVYILQNLERAAQLGSKIHRGGEIHRLVLESIKSRIDALPHTIESARVCRKLIGLLIQHKAATTKCHALLAEEYAQLLQDKSFHDLAEDFWDLASQIYRASKEMAEAARCELSAADSAVAMANEIAAKPNQADLHTVALMQKALIRLRSAKASPERIKQVHQQLLDSQAQLPAQLSTIEMNFDEMPELLKAREATHKKIQAALKSISLRDSITFLATQISPTRYDSHRASTLKLMADYPLQGLFDTVQLDHSGKTSETMEASGYGELNEDTIKQRMLVFARETSWPVTVDFHIEPARHAIVTQHDVRFHDLAFLVTSNPFIAPGREGLYLRGIQAGFYGDWCLSTHLLVPQLEESIRKVMRMNGGITSTLKCDIQTELDLNEILWKSEVMDAFGPDMVFDLRGILIERFGHNLRNDLAHGLLDEGSLYGVASIYLWWITIRLCWCGHRIANASEQNPGH